IYRTTIGTQVRAIIRNPKMAAACGIDVTRVNALTFAFGSGLAGVAGVMMSGFKTVFPDMGTPMVVDGFMVVVMGGVGSLLGSVFSAGILGEINGLVAAGTNDILARAVVFGVVIMIIILGQGLFFGAGAYMLAMSLKLASPTSLQQGSDKPVPDFMLWNAEPGAPTELCCINKASFLWLPFQHQWFGVFMGLVLPVAIA